MANLYSKFGQYENFQVVRNFCFYFGNRNFHWKFQRAESSTKSRGEAPKSGIYSVVIKFYC